MVRSRNDSRLPLHTSRFALHIAAMLAYLCLSIALTWPLVVHWQTSVVGGIAVTEPAGPDDNPRFAYGGFEDASQNVWNGWWTRRALEHGQNPYWSPLLYYPQGVQMYLQTLNLPGTLLAQPVNYLAGPVAAYNASVLLACALTGYGGFLLVRHFVPGAVIPFLCGALLTAGPFHMMKLQSNQLNLVSMQWLPLFVLALLWLNQTMGPRLRGDGRWTMDDGPRVPSRAGGSCAGMDDGRRTTDHRFWIERDQSANASQTANRQPSTFSLQPSAFSLLFAIAIFVLAALTDWYWGLICAVYAALWFALSYARSRERWRLLRRYVAFGVGVLIALAPVFIGIARVPEEAWPASARLSTWQGYVQGYSADALGLFFPSPFHPLWGAAVRDMLALVSAGYAPDGWYVAAGWVLLACAALGVRSSWRTYWHLLLIGAVAWGLSLGPTLHLAGMETGIALPYALLRDLPLVGLARRPSHFAVICIILATIFAGIGLHHLSWHWSPRQRALLLLGVSALAVIELWPPPRQSFTFEQPALFEQLRDRPGAVADLPLEWLETSRSLRHQMIHGQPILGGYVARRPEYPTRRYIPTMNWITEMRARPDIVPLTPEALAAMQCAYPVRHVIVNKYLTSAADLAGLEQVVTAINGGPLQPFFEDHRHVWYELPLFADQCAPFVYLGQGWHAREHTATKQWRWASESSDIWLVNPFDTRIAVTVKIDMEAYATARPVEIWQAEHLIGRWEVARARRPYRFSVSLPPGAHRIELRAAAAFDAATGRNLSVSVREVALDSFISEIFTTEAQGAQR